jgi:uncharacterized membrane protein
MPLAVCHRRPDRALRVGSWRSPLCARCTAFFLALAGGFAAGLPFAWLFAWGVGGLLALVVAAAVPLAVDGVTQAAGRWESTTVRRVATGALAGAAVGLAVEAVLFG